MLTLHDIQKLVTDRETSFNADYWTTTICDQRHFELVIQTKQPTDYRLLYDSWLWRQVIAYVRPAGIAVDADVLELLPGTSLTIPVALQSAEFRGKLHRVNDETPISLPPVFNFTEYWHKCQARDLLAAPMCYDLILGNHVVDDLLFALFYPSPQLRAAEVYSDPDLCKTAWDSIARCASISPTQMQIVETFLEFVRRMPLTSCLVLRHYPSTFALKSHDLTRINLEMDTFSSIAEAAQRSTDLTASFLDLQTFDVPPGSKYPNSVLLLRKKPQ